MKMENDLIDLLHKGEVLVRFKKADDTIRSMRCTLQQSRLPPITEKADPVVKRAPVPGKVTAFDLDINAWRAFRVERIIDFKVWE